MMMMMSGASRAYKLDADEAQEGEAERCGLGTAAQAANIRHKGRVLMGPPHLADVDEHLADLVAHEALHAD
jgi:hypothetical protein